jgi:hypothetical protein
MNDITVLKQQLDELRNKFRQEESEIMSQLKESKKDDNYILWENWCKALLQKVWIKFTGYDKMTELYKLQEIQPRSGDGKCYITAQIIVVNKGMSPYLSYSSSATITLNFEEWLDDEDYLTHYQDSSEEEFNKYHKILQSL